MSLLLLFNGQAPITATFGASAAAATGALTGAQRLVATLAGSAASPASALLAGQVLAATLSATAAAPTASIQAELLAAPLIEWTQRAQAVFRATQLAQTSPAVMTQTVARTHWTQHLP